MAGEGATYIRERVREEDRGYSTPCWVWQLGLTEKGYGRAVVPGFGKVRVHRAAYEIHVGAIPEGLVIDHLCRVPACCNPSHLEPVTTAENTRRGNNRVGRQRDFCRRGHPMSGDNLRIHKSGRRCCVMCNTESHRIYMREWSKTHPRGYRDRREYDRQRSLRGKAIAGTVAATREDRWGGSCGGQRPEQDTSLTHVEATL